MAIRKDFSPGEFCWIDFSAHDLESAVAWYSEIFGWSHMVMPTQEGAPPYAFFMKGEAAVGGIGQMTDEMKTQGIPPMWNSYIATTDCEAMEAKVKEIGGTVTVPTMEIPGYGKLAFFLDAEGASFAAWQSTNPDGPGLLVGEPGGLSWNELMTRDTEKAKAFYRSLVGWDFAPMQMGEIEYTMVKRGDTDAGGMMPMHGPQFEGIPAHWMIYFSVENCSQTAKQVEATGGKVHIPPTKIPVGEFSAFSDPQGGGFAVVAKSS